MRGEKFFDTIIWSTFVALNNYYKPNNRYNLDSIIITCAIIFCLLCLPKAAVIIGKLSLFSSSFSIMFTDQLTKQPGYCKKYNCDFFRLIDSKKFKSQDVTGFT